MAKIVKPVRKYLKKENAKDRLESKSNREGLSKSEMSKVVKKVSKDRTKEARIGKHPTVNKKGMVLDITAGFGPRSKFKKKGNDYG